MAACQALPFKYGEWFKDYAVLGDDVVIANERVSKRYLAIMDILGVKISLPKSVIDTRGTGVLEFAKQVFYGSVSVSPVSALAVHALSSS
jgi:hypothetical protein